MRDATRIDGRERGVRNDQRGAEHRRLAGWHFVHDAKHELGPSWPLAAGRIGMQLGAFDPHDTDARAEQHASGFCPRPRSEDVSGVGVLIDTDRDGDARRPVGDRVGLR
jgi:hypothetical protein